MNLISHGEINKKIDDYCDSLESVTFDMTANAREKELFSLTNMFGNYYAMSGYLESFKKIDAGNNTLFYYDTVSVDKQKKTSYMAICSDNKPLFLSSYTKSGDENVKYTEQSFATYDKDTKRIISRVKNSLLILDNTAELNISILDTKDSEYYRKQYKFYYDVDSIVAYQIGEDKFFNPNDSRLDLAISRIEKVSNKIRDRLDEDLGIKQDCIKEYKIKRK